MRAALRGAEACVNCVGTFDAKGRNAFDAVHVAGRGAHRPASPLEEGVRRMVHVSAIGADAASASRYAVTKAEGEAAVLAAMPGAVILRPSILFGAEDSFFNRFAGMAARGPGDPAGRRRHPVPAGLGGRRGRGRGPRRRGRGRARHLRARRARDAHLPRADGSAMLSVIRRRRPGAWACRSGPAG